MNARLFLVWFTLMRQNGVKPSWPALRRYQMRLMAAEADHENRNTPFKVSAN